MELVVLGILLLITPSVLARRDGVRDELDFVVWLARQPLAKLVMFEAHQRFATLLITAGLALAVWRLSSRVLPTLWMM